MTKNTTIGLCVISALSFLTVALLTNDNVYLEGLIVVASILVLLFTVDLETVKPIKKEDEPYLKEYE